MTTLADWKWSGTPGHFIGSRHCCFHLNTRVGRYRVSTVGCYHPASDPSSTQAPQEVASGRLYETMVFQLDSDDQTNWESLDTAGYGNQDSAEAGHLQMCHRWSAKP